MAQMRGQFYADRNAYVVQGEPAILHCHHYNCYLQGVILDTEAYLPEVKEILVSCAQEISYTQFSTFFKENSALNTDERKQTVEDYFRFGGYGVIDLSNVTAEGGTVQSSSDHYGVGWKIKFGESSEPVSHFTSGYLSGALEAIYGLAFGSIQSTQQSCIAVGDASSSYLLTPSSTDRKWDFKPSPAEGSFQTSALPQPSDTSVNYGAIREALINMPIEGAADSGLIDAFGVLLTRHYANYYCDISYSFLDALTNKMGKDGRDLAISLLTEAGRVCAFNTFGGIMQSAEWNAMIKPMFENNDDWVQGINAVVNALGWGFWIIEEFIPNEKLVVRIESGYESNSYIKKYGSASVPVSFLATGGVEGLMNLVYTLNLPETAPLTLDEDCYLQINQNPNKFVGRQLKCRAMGDEYDLFEAVKQNA